MKENLLLVSRCGCREMGDSWNRGRVKIAVYRNWRTYGGKTAEKLLPVKRQRETRAR